MSALPAVLLPVNDNTFVTFATLRIETLAPLVAMPAPLNIKLACRSSVNGFVVLNVQPPTVVSAVTATAVLKAVSSKKAAPVGTPWVQFWPLDRKSVV